MINVILVIFLAGSLYIKHKKYILNATKMTKISDPKCDDKDVYLVTFKKWISSVDDAHTYAVKSPDNPPHSGKHIEKAGTFPKYLKYNTNKNAGDIDRCMPGDLTINQNINTKTSECMPVPLRAAPLFSKITTKTYVNKVCGNEHELDSIEDEYKYTTHGIKHDSGCTADYAWSMYTRSTLNEPHWGPAHIGKLDNGKYYLFSRNPHHRYNYLYEEGMIASAYQLCIKYDGKSLASSNFCYPPANPKSGTTFSRFFAPKGAYGMVHLRDGHHYTKHCDATHIKGIAYQQEGYLADGSSPVKYGSNKVIKHWHSKPGVTGMDELYNNNNKALIYVGLVTTGLNVDKNVPHLACAYYIPDFHKNPDLMYAYDQHLQDLRRRSSSFDIDYYRKDFVTQVAANVCFSATVSESRNCIQPVIGNVTSCPLIMSKKSDGASFCSSMYASNDGNNPIVDKVHKYCGGSLQQYGDHGSKISPVKPYCYCDTPGLDSAYNELVAAAGTQDLGNYTCWYAPCQITSNSLLGTKALTDSKKSCPNQCTQQLNIFNNKNTNISVKARNRIKCSFSDDNGGGGGGGSGGGSDDSDTTGSSTINSLKQLWSNHSTEIIIILIVVVAGFAGLILLGILL